MPKRGKKKRGGAEGESDRKFVLWGGGVQQTYSAVGKAETSLGGQSTTWNIRATLVKERAAL